MNLHRSVLSVHLKFQGFERFFFLKVLKVLKALSHCLMCFFLIKTRVVIIVTFQAGPQNPLNSDNRATKAGLV